MLRPIRPYPLMPTLIAMRDLFLASRLEIAVLCENLAYRLDDVLDGEAEKLEQHRPRRRFAEGVDADDAAVMADVFPPVVGDARLDRDLAHAVGQDRLLVRAVLAIVDQRARHRHDARAEPLFGE